MMAMHVWRFTLSTHSPLGVSDVLARLRAEGRSAASFAAACDALHAAASPGPSTIDAAAKSEDEEEDQSVGGRLLACLRGDSSTGEFDEQEVRAVLSEHGAFKFAEQACRGTDSLLLDVLVDGLPRGASGKAVGCTLKQQILRVFWLE